MDKSGLDQFICSGSLDPGIVQKATDRLFPIFSAVDLAEAHRISDAISLLSSECTTLHNAQRIRACWPSPEASRAPLKNALPVVILRPNGFLPFIRQVEQIVSEAPSILIYWSRQTAARLLPGGQRYRELIRDNLCASIFSEERPDLPDEWAFIVRGPKTCLILYGRQDLDQEVRSDVNFDPRFLDGGDTHGVGVPKVPNPSAGEVGSALPEPPPKEE